jgi:hypothetical protein
MVWTQVERIDGIAKAWLEGIHERDELLRRGRRGNARPMNAALPIGCNLFDGFRKALNRSYVLN